MSQSFEDKRKKATRCMITSYLLTGASCQLLTLSDKVKKAYMNDLIKDSIALADMLIKELELDKDE